uniref:Uncharacterized protein n=1 Tax=Arundo donax TaxID=35708 RepID=A0A0A9BQR0_ARUDO
MTTLIIDITSVISTYTILVPFLCLIWARLYILGKEANTRSTLSPSLLGQFTKCAFVCLQPKHGVELSPVTSLYQY